MNPPTSEIIAKLRLKHGFCPGCVADLYELHGDILVPLTVDGVVMNGRCLICHPIPQPGAADAVVPESINPPPAAVALVLPPTAAAPTPVITKPLPADTKGNTFSRKRTIEEPTTRPNRTATPQDALPVALEQIHEGEKDYSGDAAASLSTPIIDNPPPPAAVTLQLATPTVMLGLSSAATVANPPAVSPEMPVSKILKPPMTPHRHASPPKDARDQEGRNGPNQLFVAPHDKENQEDAEDEAAENLFVNGEIVEGHKETVQARLEEMTTTADIVSVTDMHGCVYKGKLLSGTMRKGFVEVSYRRALKFKQHPGEVSYYKGQIFNGLFHGKGYSNDYANCIYRGDFKRGAAHGYGVCTWSSGRVYVGEWRKDLRHGEGRCFDRIGVRDESDLGNGLVNSGKEYKEDEEDNFKIGEEYIGEWEDDKEHGVGAFHFALGDVYVGYFVNGKMHGNGRYKYLDGSVSEGEFRNNILYKEKEQG
jgi:hypothetical protein